MRFDLLATLCALYGQDTVFLVGGELLGRSPDLARNTREFLDEVRAHSRERLVAPAT